MPIIYHHNKYFLAESGEAKEVCEAYRSEFAAQRQKLMEYCNEIGAEGYTVDQQGYFYGAQFKGKSPNGFKKSSKSGISYPLQKSEWPAAFKRIGHMPRAQDYLGKVMPIVTQLSWESGTSSGGKCIGGFIEPLGIYWFEADGPLLAIGLRRFGFCFSMIDVLYCQIKLIFMMFPGTAIFSSPVGKDA